MRSIVDANVLDRDQWNAFVDAHPRGTAFQRAEMFDVHRATRRDDPMVVAVLDDRSEIAALMVGVNQRSVSGAVGALTSRVVVWGAPLVRDDDPRVLAELLSAYGSHVRGPVYTQFRHLWDVSAHADVFETAGYRYEDHLDVLVDLTRPVDDLWKDLKHYRRKNAKRAQREGVTFRLVEDADDIELAHSYIRALYTRLRLPLPHVSYFQAMADHLLPAGLLKYFGAYHGGRLIAARAVLSHGKWLYDFWAGADETVADLQGGTVLPWEIMKWGAERGYRVFDFGGAGKPGVPYGVRDFKLAFGGELVCYGRHTLIHRPRVYGAGAAAIRLMRATARKRSV